MGGFSALTIKLTNSRAKYNLKQMIKPKDETLQVRRFPISVYFHYHQKNLKLITIYNRMFDFEFALSWMGLFFKKILTWWEGTRNLICSIHQLHRKQCTMGVLGYCGLCVREDDNRLYYFVQQTLTLSSNSN